MLSEQVVSQVIADLLDVDEESLGADTLLETIDGWDSVNAMRVLVYLEREVGSKLDYESFMKARSIGDLLRIAQAAAGLEISEGGSPSNAR